MLENRVAIITGGSSGIGKAAAIQFAKANVAVALVGRRKEQLEHAKEAILALGGKVITVLADMEDSSAPAAIVREVVSAWGRVDIIVNSAALCLHEPLPQASAELFHRHMATNVCGPYLLVQQALPYLRVSDNAAVVNISSSSASLAIPGQSMYGMSKAALEYMTKSLAAELAPGIRVNCIAPGPVDTPIHLTWAAGDVEGAYERMTKELPIARMGTAEELGAWIVFLCGEESTFVTGAVIPVDGGQVLPSALSRITL